MKDSGDVPLVVFRKNVHVKIAKVERIRAATSDQMAMEIKAR